MVLVLPGFLEYQTHRNIIEIPVNTSLTDFDHLDPLFVSETIRKLLKKLLLAPWHVILQANFFGSVKDSLYIFPAFFNGLTMLDHVFFHVQPIFSTAFHRSQRNDWGLHRPICQSHGYPLAACRSCHNCRRQAATSLDHLWMMVING